jgi:hypothetical protein
MIDISSKIAAVTYKNSRIWSLFFIITFSSLVVSAYFIIFRQDVFKKLSGAELFVFIFFVFVAFVVMIIQGVFTFNIRKNTTTLNDSEMYGYIYLDMPDAQKNVFLDILGAFKHYAKLKGYNLAFSYNSSFENKIGFKFHIDSKAGAISEERIRTDFEDYFNRVKYRYGFDDLPQVISFEEHQKELLILKNKIADLEIQYKLEKNLREYFENRFENLLTEKSNFKPHSIIVMQIGDHNSAHTTQPTGEKLIIGNNNFIDGHEKIIISNSFNDRNAQLNKINEISKAVQEIIVDNENFKRDLIECLKALGTEIEEKSNPSKSFIFEKLSTIKGIMEKLIFAHHLSESIDWLFRSFGFIS